jgi:hypoxanthine phosphoribosyltransferase
MPPPRNNTPPHPPARWRNELHSVLLSQRDIARRVRELARAIETDYADRDLLIVPLLNGTVLFVADLIRHLNLPLRLDFLGLSSYRQAIRPGRLVATKHLQLDAHHRDVLLVDDILDSGRTLDHAIRTLTPLRPRSLRTCVLLQKNIRRRLRIRPDYVGFRIPNVFVVGYGLDYAERYRNLPFIGVLRAETSPR